MKINKDIARLICGLEYLVGKECYNPRSYNGYTGEEGCDFRYPVWVSPNKKSDKMIKVSYRIESDYSFQKSYGRFSEHTVNTMKYQFGSNHLYIGMGLANVLSALEERYDLDFAQMEEDLKQIDK